MKIENLFKIFDLLEQGQEITGKETVQKSKKFVEEIYNDNKKNKTT